MERTVAAVLAMALSVALMLAAGSAFAKVALSETTKHYAVHGKNGFEVSKAMLKGGARNINMRHAIAATSTKFTLANADVAVKGGKCVVSSVTVKLDIVYLYPKWASKSAASPKVQRAWDSFHAELVKHEQTHGTIAKKAAGRIEKELRALSGTVALGCRDFGKSADKRFARIAKELKQEQLAFDARENKRNSRITQLQIALLEAR